MIHELGGCWRVWCAISRIIKLSINDFCSQTNTCVAQWAAVGGVVHISYVLCPYRAVCTESLCACVRACVSMKSFTVCFFHTSSALSPHILKYIYVWMQNTCNFTHCKRIYTLYRHSSFNLSICFFSLLSSSSCVFFLHAFSLRHSESRTIHAHRVIHISTETHRGARTHKVAWLVGAMAAALLRSPRVAPGARLPVVCQRLRVEFIQIKAVEWGPSPRMPRPSPSSAFRRWE